MTNLALARFAQQANRRFFGGRIDIAKVVFARLARGNSGRTQYRIYAWYRLGSKRRGPEHERVHILINSRLRNYGDLCKMTVFHELVHAESDLLGFYGKKNSCRKSAARFNKRMAQLAKAGAFNGLW